MPEKSDPLLDQYLTDFVNYVIDSALICQDKGLNLVLNWVKK
jgi:hypothetical protein